LWRRSQLVVLEANPDFREEYFETAGGEDERDARIAAHLAGKRLPLVGRIEITPIEEHQPRWLAFLNGEHEYVRPVPVEFVDHAMPGGRLAPNLARRGIEVRPDEIAWITYTAFNMQDPVVGGYTPEKVALRRAMSLAYPIHEEMAVIYKNQAVKVDSPIAPGMAGYTAEASPTLEYSPAKAKALLDMFGYVDRDGDGYREMPDGSRLELRHNSAPTARDQQHDELWKRSMDDIGIRFSVRKARWQDLLKESNAGKLMMWQLGGSAAAPDADSWLQTYYGPNEGFKGNRSRFKLEAYDRIYERARVTPDSPERTRMYQELTRLIVAYAPSKFQTHRILTDMWYPHVLGYRRPSMLGNHFWKYVDIDTARRDVK
jgi:ABC-type transport system substrate-binding protein